MTKETTNTENTEEKKKVAKKAAVKKIKAEKLEEKKSSSKKPAAKKTTAKKTTAKKTTVKKVVKKEDKTTQDKTTAQQTKTPRTRKTGTKTTKQENKTPSVQTNQSQDIATKNTEEKNNQPTQQISVETPVKPVDKPILQAVKQAESFSSKPQQEIQQNNQQKSAEQNIPVQSKPQKQENKPQNNSPQKEEQKTIPAQQQSDEKVIKILGQPTVKELAEKMDFKINDFIKKLMGMGIFATINQRLEQDMIELVIAECGFKAEMVHEFAEDKIAAEDQEQEDPSHLKPRAPVVTIMGHVDHGKTSLLDAIRHSNVVAGEFGAITQHIGAYRVKTPRGYISFLDTPGHEAFTAMRARGAQATDIVVLVVSATDGIMPQTIEAINHAQSAGAPIIVAVNKIDLPGANPEKVKQELANRGLIPEEWQGNTIYVEISAKKRINIDKLLEMISLQAEMMELKANPDRRGVGVILESKRDNKRGVVATVLVQKGTMHVGDPFIVGTNYGKIRALIDEHGKRLPSAGPAVPAEILGINGEPPAVGDTLFVTENEKEAKHIAEKRKLAHKEEKLAHQKHISLTSLKSEMDGKNVKELAIILKGDVHGSIEAIKDAILRTPTDEVQVKIIHSAAGNVNESDILLAKASDAVIIAFNVDSDPKAAEEAEKEGIEIRQYNIIFELLEDLRAAMEGLLEPDIVEERIGLATVRQTFDLSSGFVAGSYIEEGKVVRGYEARVLRGGQQIFKGKISGLKRFKDDVKEVEKGYECGISIDGFRQIKPGDTLECIQKKTITRRISKL